MNYRLRYETASGFADLDLGDEKPAMTYQINNLNELKDRQAAFSQAIKLPKTPGNLRALGFIDAFDAVAEAAYTPRRCELLCDGALLTPFGSMLYVDSVDEALDGFIDCQIVSGTKDLFATLADVANEEMGDERWKAVWNSEEVAAANNAPDGARRWPLMFAQRGQTAYAPDIMNRKNQYYKAEPVQVYHLVPCYRFTTLIAELLDKYGYDLESNLLTDEYLNSLYIAGSKITAPVAGAGPLKGELARFYETDIRVPKLAETISRGEGVLAHDMQRLELFAGREEGRSEGRYMTFCPMMPGTYTARLFITNRSDWPTDAVRRIDYRCYVNGALQEEVQKLRIEPRRSFSKELVNTEMKPGDFIRVQVFVWETYNEGSPALVDCDVVFCLEDESPQPGPGSRFDYMQATGFKNYREALQTYMQLFGAMVDVKQGQGTGAGRAAGTAEAENVLGAAGAAAQDADAASSETAQAEGAATGTELTVGATDTAGRAAAGRRGTVRMYTFEELYRRRDAGQYVDWSEKLVMDGERTAGFSVANYAQRNTIALKANSDDGTQDEASFTVPNGTLESEKTLFSIAVEAGRDITYTALGEQRTVAVIPTMEREVETDENGRERAVLTYKGCATHLVRMTGEKAAVLNISGARDIYPDSEKYGLELPVAVTAPVQELVDRYYGRVRQMLRHARTLTASFNLTALDIDQLDLFTPVWIGHYGAFFYISKITNFVAGQVTKVELVKM